MRIAEVTKRQCDYIMRDAGNDREDKTYKNRGYVDCSIVISFRFTN
jgi:hypothetical protein